MDPLTLAIIMAGIQTGASAIGASRAGKAGKEAERQADIARQTQESQTILNSILSQLVPGSEEYAQFLADATELVRQTGGAGDQQAQILNLGRQAVSRQQQRIAGGGAATPLESRTNLAFGDYRQANLPTPEEQAVFNALRGIAPTEGTPSDAIFADIVSQARDPYKYYQSSLEPALQLAENEVRKRAANRGVLGSGLELEDLGRTGAEMASREAEARNAYRQQQLSNYGTLYNIGQGLRERGIGVEQNLTNLQLGRETNLTDLFAGRAGAGEANALGLTNQRTGYYQDQSAQAADLARQANDRFVQSAAGFGGNAANYLTAGAFPTGSGGTFTTTRGTTAPVSRDEMLALSRSGYGNQAQANPRYLADLLSMAGGM